jgi:hypothetical protein
MQSVLYNVPLWLGHAEEARALAEDMTDPETKQKMLAVAEGYDHIAELAKEQAKIKEHYQLLD